LTIHQVEAAIR